MQTQGAFLNPHKERGHDFKMKFKQTRKQKFKVKLIKDKIKKNIQYIKTKIFHE